MPEFKIDDELARIESDLRYFFSVMHEDEKVMDYHLNELSRILSNIEDVREKFRKVQP